MFEGFAPELDARDPAAAGDARHDPDVVEDIGNWFEECWRAADDPDCPLPCLWFLEGGTDAWSLQDQRWVEPGAAT